MFNIGMGELFLFIVIALIVLGPEQLPQAIRSSIKFYKKLKNLIQHVQHEVEKELQISELQDLMKAELDKIQRNEQKMQQQLEQLHQEINELSQLTSQPDAVHYRCITNLHDPQPKPPYLPSYSYKKYKSP